MRSVDAQRLRESLQDAANKLVISMVELEQWEALEEMSKTGEIKINGSLISTRHCEEEFIAYIKETAGKALQVRR